MTRQATQNSHWSRPAKIGFALALMISMTSMAMAQDAIRPSLAGEAAAESRRQSIDNIPYNLQLGPMKLRFSATLGVEYNDNINLSEDGSAVIATPTGPVTVTTEQLSDFIIRPQINMNALWPLTQLNTLKLDLGLGYSFYLDHSNYDTSTLLISPGSQLAFDIFVGDFRFNFHDRFSIQQDPTEQIGLSNVTDYTRFENTAGVAGLWDLNSVVATLSYDYYNFVSFDDAFNYLDRHAQMVTGSVAFTPNSTMSVGVEGAFVATDYNEDVLNDSIAYSAGLFWETQVTNYLKLRIAGGYQNINFDNIGLVNDPNNVSDYYANLVLSHRVNSVLTHSLSIGHENQLGVNSNFVTLNYIRHTANWNIFLHTLLTTELFYEDAIDSGGYGYFIGTPGSYLYNPFAAETIHRYGGALALGYQLTQHVTLGLRYQYIQKDSNLPLRDYRQNRVSLDGTYSF
jgi:hypothetical protein